MIKVRTLGFLANVFVLCLFGAVTAQAQTETVLYSFCSQPNCADGYEPYSSVVKTGTRLYGTTLSGGINLNCGGRGCGTAFELKTYGKNTVLHSFGAGEDGSEPYGGLIEDKEGNVYGTTVYGGVHGFGAVFKLSAKGAETVLHSFDNDGKDGYWPEAGLVIDKNGNLYGTTIHGGSFDSGTVFRVSVNGKEAVLHSFGGDGDGAYPEAALVMDNDENLYGTTVNGGAHLTCNDGFSGCGTVFAVSSHGAEKTLHSFSNEGTDGYYPYTGLVIDEKGNLYGTTQAGGVMGNGTVYKITTQGAERVVYSFGTNAMDGYSPYAGLVIDTRGNLYGTTPGGGIYGYGAVFKVGADGTETILHNFNNDGLDGNSPFAALSMDEFGNLYGTTVGGGSNAGGTVFQITPH